MDELETLGVQEVAAISRKPGPVVARHSAVRVEWVANEGMPDCGQMDPDLVRASGRDPDENEGAVGTSFQDGGHAVSRPSLW